MDNHLYTEFTLLSAISKPVLKKKIKKKRKSRTVSEFLCSYVSKLNELQTGVLVSDSNNILKFNELAPVPLMCLSTFTSQKLFLSSKSNQVTRPMRVVLLHKDEF